MDKADLERLVRIDERTAHMTVSLKRIQTDLEKMETRISVLEKWQSKVLGAIAAVGTVAGTVFGFLINP